MIDRFGMAMGAMLTIGLLLAGTVPAAAATIVPPGNRNAEQPAVPGASARRTSALKTTYDRKYRKIYDLLAEDDRLRRKIVETAEKYEIDPLHIVGAIVGEHTYNVDAYDRLQTYYVKAASYLTTDFGFSYDGESVDAFVERPPFERCDQFEGSYDLWTCRESVWEETYRGRTVDETAWPDDRFSATFFQPFYAGQTFGLGQLNPLTALQMNEMVNEVSGYDRLSESDPHGVYEAIMDPDQSLAYIAATIRKSIEAYEEIAGFDISGNPGVTSTLYNLGNPESRARKTAAENQRRSKSGQAQRLPEENYYGWLVNDRLAELRSLFPSTDG